MDCGLWTVDCGLWTVTYDCGLKTQNRYFYPKFHHPADPNMKEKSSYTQIKDELNAYLKPLANAANVITEQEVSDFPIFVVHQHSVDIGINIVDKETVKGNWSVNASTLEEFVTKQIIQPEKVDDFKTVYKNHQGEICLFVLSDLGANFVFLPVEG